VTYRQKGVTYCVLIGAAAMFTLAAGLLGDCGLLGTSFSCAMLGFASVGAVFAVSDIATREPSRSANPESAKGSTPAQEGEGHRG
jgi:hypothetical protein